MTSKVPKQKIDRIPKQKVVQGASVIVTPNSPDYLFLQDNPSIIKKEGGVVSGARFLTGAFSSGSSIFPSPSGGTTSVTVIPPDVTTFVPDAPSLADIEKIDYEEYADPSTGVSKYRAIIKIRNSSKEKINVDGVDARIYDPNGANTYTFTTTTASGSATTSSYISSTTWYKAVATFNPFEGVLVSSEAISSNAQYPSDGTGVPADVTIGITTNIRSAQAWRKTEAEALAAVKALYAKYII